MKTIKIEDISYKVCPMPLHCSVYSDLLATTQKQVPTTVEEAEKQANTIKQLQDKILAETVTPTPQTGHTLELYQTVIAETNLLLKRADYFRDKQK
jgi:hypothetical protein